MYLCVSLYIYIYRDTYNLYTYTHTHIYTQINLHMNVHIYPVGFVSFMNLNTPAFPGSLSLLMLHGFGAGTVAYYNRHQPMNTHVSFCY